jgi:hypothetical protein
MTMNVSKVYTQKSNCKRDFLKAVSAGELRADAWEVAPVEGGFSLRATAANEASPTQGGLVFLSQVRDVLNGASEDDVLVPFLRKKPTPQVPALPGVTPLGLRPAAVLAHCEALTGLAPAAPVAEPVPAPVVAPKPAPAAEPGLLPDAHLRVLVAVYDHPDCAGQADAWVLYPTLNDSPTPHALPPRQVPGVLNALQRRGLIVTAMATKTKSKLSLTPAGVAAVQHAAG